MSTEERRAPGAMRIPFDALVEVGGALGPTFEAQAVNVSGDGIQLRTAYLPEPGQPLTCRFDAGTASVLAAGEVVWAQGVDRGGEFGVRFTDVDASSVEALKRVCGLIASTSGQVVPPGSKVRIHIDGLAAPMRAKIKDSGANEVTVGSDLGFLQVGRQVELEDAQSGGKRPAHIDRVDVAIDPGSHVPQLVVTLRYSDMPDAPPPAPATSARVGAASSVRPPAPRGDDLDAIDEASAKMKGAVARGIERIGPAVRQFAERAKTTVAILGKRRRERSDDASARRTTAPPPGGGLHAPARRVLRSQSGAAEEPPPAAPNLPNLAMTKRRAVLAGGIMFAAILGALALKKMHHEPVVDPTAASASASASVAAAATAPPPAASASLTTTAPAESSTASAPLAAAAAGESDESEAQASHKKHPRVTPFGNGAVHHGNVLHLKMDGPVESLEGAQQPTGFAVKIPGRKAVEAAAPLAARDSRIATIKVANDTAGAELTVTFKDGVPNYRVSAKGDTLVIALAPPGATEAAVAKKDENGGRSAKHKHAHDKKKSEQEL